MCKFCSELAMEIAREKNLNGERHHCEPIHCEPTYCDPRYLCEYGPVVYCIEDQEGYLWAGNEEYKSNVNYCPFCGYKATERVEEYKRNDIRYW